MAFQAPQDSASAKAFLESAYRHYEHNGKGINIDSPAAKQFYHSSLLSLIKADAKAADGDIPALEGDPICSCQDWDGIWNLAIAIQMQGDDKAAATVSFSLSRQKTKTDLRALDISLAAEGGHWRIYDIVDNSDPKTPFALRAELIKDIEAHTHHTATKPRH